MKKKILLLLSCLGTSFLLSGLQGNFYFLPIPMPYFWFIVLTYYSFQKSIVFSLITNIFHALILSSFTSLSVSLLLVCLNLMTFIFATISERFNTTTLHIAIASGLGSLFFSFFLWTIQSLHYNFTPPPVGHWLGTSIMTFIFSVPLFFLLKSFDHKIQYERIDTLENLRI
jgi:nitrogen fixation-related uncharacterized protein